MAPGSGGGSGNVNFPLPSKLVWLTTLVLLAALCATVGYAVWDNRTIVFYPPSIQAKNDAGAAANASYLDIVDATIAGIDVPVLVYRKQPGNLVVVAANDAAAEFYVVSKAQLIGRTPDDLHTFVRPWISNFGDWAAEQIGRISQASGSSTKPLGKTTVPMKLLGSHPTFKGEWYITSNNVKIGDTQLIVSRFSNSPTIP